MRRMHLRTVIGAAFLIAALTVAPASAQQPESTPGGPWAQPNQNESLSAIRDYDELVSTLERLVARGNGAAKLTYSPFRAKGSGRAIPIVTIGSGGRGIVIVANQHGDEFTVSNSAVELVRALTSNAAGAQEIRDAVTRDGHAAGEHRRLRRDADRRAVAPQRRPVLHDGAVPGVLRGRPWL